MVSDLCKYQCQLSYNRPEFTNQVIKLKIPVTDLKITNLEYIAQ